MEGGIYILLKRDLTKNSGNVYMTLIILTPFHPKSASLTLSLAEQYNRTSQHHLRWCRCGSFEKMPTGVSPCLVTAIQNNE
ncbi:hypothetical protein AVEN_166552-1, partial [Araneus ventricosus]